MHHRHNMVELVGTNVVGHAKAIANAYTSCNAEPHIALRNGCAPQDAKEMESPLDERHRQPEFRDVFGSVGFVRDAGAKLIGETLLDKAAGADPAVASHRVAGVRKP